MKDNNTRWIGLFLSYRGDYWWCLLIKVPLISYFNVPHNLREHSLKSLTFAFIRNCEISQISYHLIYSKNVENIQICRQLRWQTITTIQNILLNKYVFNNALTKVYSCQFSSGLTVLGGWTSLFHIFLNTSFKSGFSCCTVYLNMYSSAVFCTIDFHCKRITVNVIIVLFVKMNFCAIQHRRCQ